VEWLEHQRPLARSDSGPIVADLYDNRVFFPVDREIDPATRRRVLIALSTRFRTKVSRLISARRMLASCSLVTPMSIDFAAACGCRSSSTWRKICSTDTGEAAVADGTWTRVKVNS
jgi:hypothetical protein